MAGLLCCVVLWGALGSPRGPSGLLGGRWGTLGVSGGSWSALGPWGLRGSRVAWLALGICFGDPLGHMFLVCGALWDPGLPFWVTPTSFGDPLLCQRWNQRASALGHRRYSQKGWATSLQNIPLGTSCCPFLRIKAISQKMRILYILN